MTKITDLIDRWNTNEGKPYKGSLIDLDSYEDGNLSCQRVRRTGWTNDGNHIGMEFWVFHPAAHPSEEYPQDDCREGFEAFADAIRALAEKQP